MSSFTPASAQMWRTSNQTLLAKIISELHYEECFQINAENNIHQLSLSSGVLYRFSAWQSRWGQLRINPNSIERCADDPHPCEAQQFFIDAQQELQLDPIVLGNLLEETAQTLFADCQRLSLCKHINARDLAHMDCDTMQTFMEGHPKAILNKGRLGWGSDSLQRYTPEANQLIQLHWVAVKNCHLRLGIQENNEAYYQQWIAASMSDTDYLQLQQLCRQNNIDFSQWRVLPVHPWQWQRFIQVHFQDWLAQGDMIHLGQLGHQFRALQSIRTLANQENLNGPNIKLPVTILNTSCYRGIPGQYIEAGAPLSNWLQNICNSDALLLKKGTQVLKEPLGVHCQHSSYSQVSDAPYRYQELLGAIFRDSVHSHLDDNENAMLVAALLQQDQQGRCLVLELIDASGLSTQEWMQAYFDSVVIPLYHLLCQYGVGLVAHGQNLTLVLENHCPKRLILKDLQGDLRIVNQDFPELQSMPEAVKEVLTKLPAEYLLHDLLTGHFVTVLRYLSALLEEQGALEEELFYRELRLSIERYQQQHSQLQTRFQMFDLLAPTIHRVCINRVRFQQGYNDRAERPVPIVGSDIVNPLIGDNRPNNWTGDPLHSHQREAIL